MSFKILYSTLLSSITLALLNLNNTFSLLKPAFIYPLTTCSFEIKPQLYFLYK